MPLPPNPGAGRQLYALNYPRDHPNLPVNPVLTMRLNRFEHTLCIEAAAAASGVFEESGPYWHSFIALMRQPDVRAPHRSWSKHEARIAAMMAAGALEGCGLSNQMKLDLDDTYFHVRRRCTRTETSIVLKILASKYKCIAESLSEKWTAEKASRLKDPEL